MGEVTQTYGGGVTVFSDFMVKLKQAGYLRHLEPSLIRRIKIFTSSSEYATVDELMSLLWSERETKYSQEARKYTLGYFGGSGSTKVKLNNLNVGGLVSGSYEQKRDEIGRWIPRV